MSEFLRYIVEEQIAGRGAEIKGKTVAVHVYKREIDPSGSAQNLVRVEAQRLRRSLDEYYANEGSDDVLKIVINSGGYRPNFVDAGSSSKEDESPAGPRNIGRSADLSPPQGFWIPRRAAMLTGVCFILLVSVVGFTTFSNKNNALAKSNANESSSAELAALRERSMTSVQAINIANQTRGTFFPLFDIKRQMIALESFEHAAELDPELPAGHAGTAQVLALLSMLSTDAERAEELLARAVEHSELALGIAPTDAWANAARSWVLAVARDSEEALRRARIAMELAPEDGHSLDLVGIAAFLAGDAALSAEASHPSRARNGEGRFGANNIWGVAQLSLGNYNATIEAFSTSAERGIPVSAPTLLLLATAYREIGDLQASEKTIAEMASTWPDFPARAVTDRFFMQHPKTRDQVIATLQAFAPQIQ